MTLSVCSGCGAGLQTQNPALPGFVPAQVISERNTDVVCRRCYRIEHYGVDETPAPAPETLRDQLRRRAETCALAVLVVDLVDFEGTFEPLLAKSANGKLLVAANKIDLLPKRTPPSEIQAWVEARLAAAGVRQRGVFLISGANRSGTAALWEAVTREASTRGDVLLMGATNVGKSTLLADWADGAARPPTISRFPGTTQGEVRRKIADSGVNVVDTPGVAPKGRLSDQLCPKCAIELIPKKELVSRLIGLRPGQAVAWGGFAAVQYLGHRSNSGEQVAMLFFSADGIQLGRVNARRATQVLEQGGWRPGHAAVCENCRSRLLSGGTEEIRLEVGAYEDVAVHGLGWFSLRPGTADPKASTSVRVTLPAGVQVSVRPRLVGPKRPPRARTRE